jgi:transcriptional regulator with XRE-family HTH domain
MARFNKNQCAAARQLLEWTQDDLSTHSGASRRAISDFERGAAQPRGVTMDAIEAAFASKGIQFLEGGGVDLKTGDKPRAAT